MKKRTTRKAIAHRKSCTTTGTGLSHYILIKEK
ncbi:MAG: modified peptide precursor CbpA [Lentisphaerae bacterium GWF2_50_93]|nr:MAG: modified peptide precursor CbpA [Lentisphaerae bacterium GWF2_50_93]